MAKWASRDRTDRGHASRSTSPGDASSVTGTALSLRTEKILLTLAVQVQQLNDRLTRLEERFEVSLSDTQPHLDEHDLLDLRMHSARLGAELSRVTIELRAEINDLATGLNATTPTGESDETSDAAVLDLRDTPSQAPPRPYRSSGWRPARANAARTSRASATEPGSDDQRSG